MKLLIFSYVFRPESFLINELADSLSERHSVTVYTGLPNYPKGEFFEGYSLNGPYYEKQNLVEVIRYPILPRKRGFFNLALNYASHLFFSILKLAQLPKSDVYFVFATSPLWTALPAILLKKFSGKPVVIWYQDLWPESFVAVTKVSPHSLFVKFLEKVTRYIYKNTDVMMIQSEAFKKSLSKYSFSGKTVYIPNWSPDAEDSHTTPEWIQALDPQKKIISFAGNIGKAQALDTLLEAASKIKDPELLFLVVGDGSDKERLQARALELGLNNVIFAGRKPLNDMPALFRRSDFLYASLAKDELFALTLPSKVQSYMAAAKPIIVSLDGEGSRIVALADCGFTAAAESSEELILAIEKALKLSQVERESLGLKGKEYYQKHFAKKHVLALIEKELEELL